MRVSEITLEMLRYAQHDHDLNRITFKAKETPKGGGFDMDAHHELARKIAIEGMVLLKNDGLCSA